MITNEKSQLRSIDLYDVFELLGLSKISPFEKKTYIEKMNNLIIEEFYLKIITSIKNKIVLSKINKMILDKKSPSKIIEFLSSNLPLFTEKLLDYVRFRKKDFINKYYNNIVESLDKKLLSVDKVENIIRVKEELKYYLIAQRLAKQELWNELSSYISKIPDFSGKI